MNSRFRPDYPAPSRVEIDALLARSSLAELLVQAAALRDRGHGPLLSYSRKVFIPLTHLCRDVCHYCTFATTPSRIAKPFMTPDEVLDVARQGAAAGCHEALFTLGDKPELRYEVARRALAELGHATTLEYLVAMARLVFEETGLLPHLNPGVMTREELAAGRAVSVSQGIMLESSAARLGAKGGPHHGSPDKVPQVRLDCIAAAGELAIPFTSGILIGIGETRAERIDSLFALRDLHERHGHLQEIIIQNFRAKPGTRMAGAPDATLEELLWTIAAARLIFGPAMNLQTPPNLNDGSLAQLIAAGINDWGGVSPVTPDFVNPEKPWPHLEDLARQTAAAGKLLVERLPLYPAHTRDLAAWQAPAMATAVRRAMDSDGLARRDAWSPGMGEPPTFGTVREGWQTAPPPPTRELTTLIARAVRGERLDEAEIARLFRARGAEFSAVCEAADQLRRSARYARQFARLLPELHAPIESFITLATQAHARHPDGAARPIHGAPHPQQWLLGTRVGLVDFDRVGSGPVELDAATFVAELDFESLDDGLRESLSATFLAAYAERVGGLDAARLDLYRAHKHFAKAFKTAAAIRSDRRERSAQILAGAVALATRWAA